MELGNAIFGHSRGEYEVPRDDDESKRWLLGRVLDPRQLVLHSNEPGDSIGTVIAADIIDDNAPAMRKVYERGDGEYEPKAAK